MLRRLLAWAGRNERHLGAIVFLAGFITDIIAFTLLDVSIVNAIFAVYLGVAGLAILLGHVLASQEEAAPSTVMRTITVLSPLVAQYFIGNLLSGFLIFYTKSADPFASWPFLLVLLLVFVGNEWFRKYKDRIAFIAVLYFFALYAYVIFALPLFWRELGPGIFLGSTGLALGIFALYLGILFRLGRKRLLQAFPRIIASVLVITGVVVGSYFTGLVPPIPLTLAEGGIYNHIVREGGTYVLTGTPQRVWWDIRPDVVYTSPGETLYAYSAIAAPVRFGAGVVHRWQQYDDTKNAWVTKSRIAFPIEGGREGGYRAYSLIENHTPGEWRVRVETENGLVIGQIRFTLSTEQGPARTTTTR